MEKEFIPYEQALALKELGFGEPCFAIYNLGLSEFETANIGQMRLFSSLFRIDDKQSNISYVNDKNSSKVTAPLYQQAFKWFRKTHNLHGFIENSCIMNDNNYNCFINATDQSIVGLKSKRLFNMYNFKTYEQAELECLKKLIKIVKTK